MLLKAKTKGKTFQNDKYPIVGLLKVTDITHFEDTTKTAKDFKFLEWAYIKPLPPQPAVTILK